VSRSLARGSAAEVAAWLRAVDALEAALERIALPGVFDSCHVFRVEVQPIAAL
jgi:hypothetical protein